MRNKIGTLLLAFALILPCSLLFTACSKDNAKVTSIAVELATNDYTMTDNTIIIPWGGKVELDSTDFIVTATLDNNETKVIEEKTETQDGFSFSSSIPNDAITPIGEYSVIFSHEQAEEDVEIDVSVVKADVDMTGVVWNYTDAFTYDENEKSVELSSLPAGVSVEYKTKLSTENGLGEVGNSAINAGVYTTTAIFTYSDSEHFNAIPNKVINWEIQKADIIISSITTQSFVYDGTEKTATITSALPEGVSATITGDKNATNAGTYNIVVSFEYTGVDSANYNPIADLEWSWSISPAKFTNVGEVILSENYDLKYNGADQTVELDLTGLDTSNVRVVNVTGLTAKNTGIHKAIVEIEYIGASTNFNSVDNIEVEWEIGKAPLTVTAIDKTITYGDSATNDGVSYTGLVGGEGADVLTGSLVYDYDGYVIGSSVGTYDITPSGLSSANYEISFVKGTLTVDKKALIIKANDATIDYNTDAINNGVVPTGLIASDTVAELGTLTYSYGGYTKGSDVGVYDITVSGLDDTNYSITYQKGVLSVEKIDVDVDVTGIELLDNSLVYTGAELSVEVNEATLPQGVTVTNIVTRDKTAINVDEYIAVIYLQYFDTTNYNPMEEITRTWNIEKATVGSFDNVAINQTEFIYTGLKHTVELVNIPAGAKIDSITGMEGTVVDEYIVEVTFVCSDTTNYNDFEPVHKTYTWNITPATLTAKANDHIIIYGQNITDNGYIITGFVNNETESVVNGTISYSYTYNLGDDVGTYEIIPSGLSADNYIINFVSGILTVEKAQLDFTSIDWLKNSPYSYTGTAIKPVLSGNVDFVEITYSYSQGGGLIDNPINVGTYVAHAEIELTNTNYEIINNSIVDFEYQIIAQKVNVSTLTWNATQLEYTGEQILPEISELPNTLNVVYSYTQDSEVVEPINIGTYIAHAELTVISENYEIEGTFADLTYYIIPKEVDCSNLAWTDSREYTFNGEEFKPTLQQELEGLEINYAYFEGEGTQTPAESVVNAGTYTGVVSISPASENYTLINYNQLENITFVINKMQIDVGNVEWESVENLTYTGNAIKPKLSSAQNLPTEHLNFEYYYTDSTMIYPVKDSIAQANIEPVNVGEYTAWAFMTLTYDVSNYEIRNNGVLLLVDYLQQDFVINEAEAVLGEIDWNINTTLNDKSDYSQYHSATVEITGEPMSIIAVGDFEMFDIEYRLEYNVVESVSIVNVGYYYITAEITLKEEYEQNYWFVNYTIVLNLEVNVNPFEIIAIDGEGISYNDFVAKDTFEYMSEITFTLKEGYTAYNDELIEITSVIIDDNYPVLIIKDAEENEVFSKYGFNYYYFDEIIVGDTTITPDSDYTVYVQLASGQNTFDISFDERYLSKYASMITYQINYAYNEPATGVITALPFVVENATEVVEVSISLDDSQLHSINVVQYSRITEIAYTTITFNSDEEHTETLEYNYSWVNLSNAILISLVATVEDGYTLGYFADSSFETEVDFTDLNNLTEIYIVVYENEEIVETKCVNISFNLYCDENYNISNENTFNVEGDEFDISIPSDNPNLTIISLINNSDTLELTTDITIATYELTIEYNLQVYTYSKQITIIKTLNVVDCVSEEALNNGEIYLINTDTNDEYYINIYYNSINLYEYYDASTIKNLDLDALEFPVAEGYVVSNKELVSVNGTTYLKLTLTSESETLALTEEEYNVYILLEFDGSYDNDVSADIEVFDVVSGYTSVDANVTQINIDIATQGIDVTLNNNYAKAVITDSQNSVLVESNYGYFSGVYNFTTTGTYYLIITATDGTTKTYTINVTGEVLPLLEVVVGDVTLSQSMGQYGPTEGDFEWEMLDSYGTEMSFTAMVGADAQSLINEGTITITSLRASMLSAATIYDSNDIQITDLENFTLTVLGDESAPYVMFYAVATVQGQTTTSYIILYLCDELPAMKILEVVVGETTYTEVLDSSTQMPTGDFEMQVLNDSETAMEWMFIAYLGAFDEIPATLTLDSISCLYTGIMTDLISGETFTSLQDVTLEVGTIGNDTIPCVAYSIVFSPMAGYTVTVDVVLYLMDRSEISYPAVINIGENSYNFKLNAMSLDFGDVTMDMDNYNFYITETVDAQTLTEITITLSQLWNDYSYMVLIGNAYENYFETVEENNILNSNYIDTLLAEGTQAFRITDEQNLTMTIPIQFVNGLAYFDIACEGFVGYIPENSVHDLSFIRVYIVIDGIGQLPDNGNGENSVVGDVVEPLPDGVEISVTVNNVTKTEQDFHYSNQYGAFFVEFDGMNIADIMNTQTSTLTISSFSTNLGTRFTSRNDDEYDITSSFDVEVGSHGLGYGAYFFVQIESAVHPIILLFDDSNSLNDPNGGNGENPEIPDELPSGTVFTITIGTETLTFEDLIWDSGAYIGIFTQNAGDLQDANNEISATIMTNLDGLFKSISGNDYDITINNLTEIQLESQGDVWGVLYNQEIFFVFIFGDTNIG